MDVKKVLGAVFILLMFLNLVQIAQNFYLTQGVLQRHAEILELKEGLLSLHGEYQAAASELGKKQEELNNLEADLAKAQVKIITLDKALEKKQKQIYTLGVTDGRGVAMKLTVEMEKGTGRLLADTKNIFFETDVQGTMRSAFLAARNLTGAEMSSEDFTFTIVNPLEGNVVITGESAGAAMAVALVALVEGKNIRDDAAITGLITRDGGIGKVSQIEKKAIAAENAGVKLLLVPPTQGLEVEGLEVKEVANLSEASELLLY